MFRVPAMADKNVLTQLLITFFRMFLAAKVAAEPSPC
jgi:hypothetical protein